MIALYRWNFKDQTASLLITVVLIFLPVFEFEIMFATADSVEKIKRKMDESYCGKVSISDKITVELRDGTGLTTKEFESLRQNLQGAVIEPQENCAIQVCGFTSFGSILKEGFVGVM